MENNVDRSHILTFPDAGACTAMGRNGKMKVSGTTATYLPGSGRVTIMPLTSRGVVGNCRLDIPIDEIPAFIEMLREITADAPLVGPQGIYHDNNGTRCPLCDCENLEREMLADNGEDARRAVKCSECGAQWEDVYRLKTFVNFQFGKES